MGMPWEIYGFEASPLIAPYTESCAAALNLGRPLPDPPIPPTGSSAELWRLQQHLNCSQQKGAPSRKNTQRVFDCMLQRLRPQLDALKPDPALNMAVVERRLRSASECPMLGPERPLYELQAAATSRSERYTMVPAGVGGSNGTITLFGSRQQLLLGGLQPGGFRFRAHADPAEREEKHVVPSIDLVWWLRTSFRLEDYVVLKLDVEGAEQEIVPALAASGADALIDVLLWECHAGLRTRCWKLDRMLDESGVGAVYREPKGGGDDAWRKVLSRPRGLRATDSSGCSVRLIEQTGDTACTPNVNFGCAAMPGQFYVKRGCRGKFRCNSTVHIAPCASLANKRKLCSCDG